MDLVGDFVNLNACAIHLPFENHIAREFLQGFVDVCRRLRQHGIDRREKCQLEFVEGVGTLQQGDVGDGAQALRIHRGTAYDGHREVGGEGNGIDHHTDERALAEFSNQKVDEEFLFGAAQLRKQLAQHRGAVGGGTCSAKFGECGQSMVHR